MKNFLPIIVFLIFSQKLAAQQEAHYTHFMYNKMLINPAYAGARPTPHLTAIHRTQWAGFEGAPSSQLMSFSSKFILDRVGVGATISHVKIGHQQDIYGNLAYSYDLIAKDGISIRAGLQGSIRSFSLNFGNPNDLILSAPNDETIKNGNIKKVIGNFGAGIYGSYKDVIYAGFSVPTLIGNSLNSKNFDPTAIKLAKLDKHFYGMIGASLPVADQVKIVPQVLIKYVKNAPIDADLNATLEYDRKFGVGLSYRLGGDGGGESADLLIFARIKNQFVIGASYDFTLSQIKDYSSGSFEILLQADLKKTKNEMSNPRFFF
jgi:type IX secretion system PorP/SprF family membrane protein